MEQEQELSLNIKIVFLMITLFFLGGCGSATSPKPEIKDKKITKKKYKPPILKDRRGEYCPYDNKTIIIGIKRGKGVLTACENHTIKRYINVSSGEPKHHKTVRGNFRVLRKYKQYDSKKYPSMHGGRNMDYAQFFYRGFAFHSGNIKRYSHGCVRVQRYNAKWLYNWTNHGTKVIVKDL
jgi:lipoprotein-anchoring transpeptidase ErfK/SrfK